MSSAVLVQGGSLIAGKMGAVVMLHNVPEKLNCHHILALACLYGNVIVIRKLVKQPTTAMLQFSDVTGANVSLGRSVRLAFDAWSSLPVPLSWCFFPFSTLSNTSMASKSLATGLKSGDL